MGEYGELAYGELAHMRTDYGESAYGELAFGETTSYCILCGAFKICQIKIHRITFFTKVVIC